MDLELKKKTVYVVEIPRTLLRIIANTRHEAIRKAILIAITQLKDRLNNERWNEIKTSIDEVYEEVEKENENILC